MARLNIPPIRVIRGSDSPMPPVFFRVFPRPSAAKNITSQQHSSAYADGSPQDPTCSCHSWFKIPQPPVFFSVFPRPSAAKNITSPTTLVGSRRWLASTSHLFASFVVQNHRMPPALFRVFRVLPWFKFPQPAVFFSGLQRQKTSPHNNTRRLTPMARLNSPPIRVIRGSKSPECPLPSSVPSASFPWFRFPQPPVFFRVFPRPSAAKRHHLTTTLVGLRRWLASTSHLFVSFVVQTPPCHQYFSAFFRGLQRQKTSPHNNTRRLTPMARLNSPPIRVIRGTNSPNAPCTFPCFPCPSVVQIPPPTSILQRFTAAFSGKKTSPHQHPAASGSERPSGRSTFRLGRSLALPRGRKLTTDQRTLRSAHACETAQETQADGDPPPRSPSRSNPYPSAENSESLPLAF